MLTNDTHYQKEVKMDTSNRELDSIIEKIGPHKEMILAIVSGIVIILAWRIDTSGLTTASVITYICAYIIGGYAKAKEGILDTLKNRTLNVELLMILAAIGSGIIGYWTEGAIL